VTVNKFQISISNFICHTVFDTNVKQHNRFQHW